MNKGAKFVTPSGKEVYITLDTVKTITSTENLSETMIRTSVGLEILVKDDFQTTLLKFGLPHKKKEEN